MITLYTYACVDRIVRTRCGRHIQRTGPHAIREEAYRTADAMTVEHNQPAHRCIECFYQSIKGLDHHDD